MTEVWHYTDLIKAHKILLNEEGRFRFYEAYMKNREPNAWLKSPDVPLKEALLLFGWVHSWDPNFEGELVRFLQIYEDVFPLLKSFENKTIVTIDFTEGTRSCLARIFDSLANCCRTARFESTDTSKILHAIIPDLFVMWDDKIKKATIGVRGSGKDYDGKCYAYEFFPRMQELAKKFLDSFVKEHGGSYENASMRISEMADGYTLAKLIDEINYLRFTRKRTLEGIRKEGTDSPIPNIESDFHNEMVLIYKKAKEQCHYNATYFLRLVSEVGGLQAAKILLSADAPQYGFTKLWEYGRLDLSMEVLVLKPHYRILFTEDELKIAKKRLAQYGYAGIA